MKYGQKGFSALSTLTKVALTILSLVSGTLTVSEDVFNSDVKSVRDFQGKVLSTYSDNSNKFALTMQDFRDAEKKSMDSYDVYIKKSTPAPSPAPKPTPVSAPTPAPAKKVCSPGSYSCSGNGRQVCNSTGTGWGSAGTCVCGCSSGTCSRCTEKQTEELRNTTQDFREADQKSMESYEIYIEQKQNDANNTTRICIPGASPKCDGNTRQICNPEGTGWKSNGTCPCGCSGGTCNTCTVQQTKELTNTIQDFKEADQKSMESYEIYFKDGNAECNLGEKKCRSNTAYSCNSKGVYVLSQVCSLGCDGSGCKKAECIPYSTKCSGDNKREVCNSNGTGWSYGGTCPCGCNSGVCNRCTEEEIVEKTKTRQDFREADQESMESYDVYVENQKKIEQEKLEERIKALLEFKKIDNESYKEYLKSIGDTGSCTVGQTTCSTLGTISILYKCSDGKNLTAQTTCKNGCNGNTCASYICKPLDTKCIDRDTPARCSSDGMSWINGSTCSVGCNMETGSCYADSGTVEAQKIPTCSKGQGCGEGWYCNGDAVPGTSGSFTSQYCTKEDTEEKKTLWETIEEKAEAAFGSGEYLSFGDGTNAVPAYCYLDTDEGRDCRNAMENVGTVILGTAGVIIGGAVGGPQGAAGLGLFGSTIIPLTKDIGCEISGNCSEQEKLAIQEQLFYALAGAQTFVEIQMGVNAQTNINNFWQSQIDSIVPDGDDLFRANTVGASNISANIYPEFEYADDTNKLAKYITGLDLDDPNMRDLLVEDISVIRNKYSLPPKEMLNEAPGEYLSSLQEIASKEGIEIIPEHEAGGFFKANPKAGGVSFDSGSVGGRNVISAKNVVYSGEENSMVHYSKYKDTYIKYARMIEHELVHALQKIRHSSMPNEIMEYEAYMAAKNTSFIQNATPSDLNNYIFGPFSIKGSVDFHYNDINEMALYMLNK